MEKSCGAVVYTLEEEPLYLLIKNLDNGFWGFPKGHVESGENELETAIREVQEETGISINPDGKFKETVTYHTEHDLKTVIYFLAKINSKKVLLAKDEIVDFKWLKYEDALTYLIFDNSKKVLKKANDLILSSK